MKKFKFAIAAMVIAVGVIGAFAFGNADDKEPVKEEAQTTYYAIRVEGTNNFFWSDNQADIAGKECLTLPGASCSVEATSQPDDNTNPDLTPDNQAWQEP
ncbi:hypothetical protein LS482_08675 [Sinomicrobium kalidii]|uniref:hypothetical protein n=1 Tax=Sinomicrobium kalidii TaxID=2900738 RepID=UPI001E63342C|nr:hypothetical protein [Sinomicrobium kalidii]UGU17941.1 hypothetical protein LS482_08675 [Sinomicrobium kalidii]